MIYLLTNKRTYRESYADPEAHKETAKHQDLVGIRKRHDENTHNETNSCNNKCFFSPIGIGKILGRQRTKHYVSKKSNETREKRSENNTDRNQHATTSACSTIRYVYSVCTY